MPFPDVERLELPILQELEAAGGADRVRYLYDRLVSYFPQLTDADTESRTPTGRKRWHGLVQRAGRELHRRGELHREGALWSLTSAGKNRIAAEALRLSAATESHRQPPRDITHKEAQRMLVAVGHLFGYHAEAEFEYYDVVWRESVRAPRLSHVFEVQVAGNVDSALTRLKQAYDAQRSRPFLVIADERATQFAARRLAGSFHEIEAVITVIGTGELQRLYDALTAQEELLLKLISRT